MPNTNKRGRLIRKKREAMELTRQELAANAECSIPTIQRIECSEHECGSAAVLARIAAELDLDLDDVITSARPARRVP